MSSQFGSHSLTSRSKQGVAMQEKNRRYSIPTSGNLSRVERPQRLNAKGTDSLTNEPIRPFSPPSVSQTYRPSGRFDLQVTRPSISPTPPPNNNEIDRPSSRRCLSTPKHNTCLDTSTFSQHLPKRETMLSIQDVKLCKHTSLGQLSNGCHTSADFSTEPLHRKEMLPCISEYWASRIPDYFKAFRDRTLPDWDPDEEYQALLDFTYPLRPLNFTSKDLLDGEDLSCGSCFKDPGIVADGSLLSPANTLTSKSTLTLPAYQTSSSDIANPSWAYNNLRESVAAPRRSSSPLPSCNQPSNLTSPLTLKARLSTKSFLEHSRINKAQLSDSLINSTITSDCTLTNSITDSGFLSKNSSEEFTNHLISGDDSTSFLSTAQILPLNKEWGSDEEYLSLPYKLNELEDLARQLENLSAHLDESADVTGVNVTTRDVDVHDGGAQDILSDLGGSSRDLTQLYRQQGSEPINTCDYSESEDAVMELKKATDFIRKLGRWPGSRLTNQQFPQVTEEKQNGDCLLIHIQNFSTKLEEMVQWLYKVAETTDNWTPPQPEMESIKSSLDVCMAFKNDVNEHRELTESVLKSGEILLKSVIDTTPVLKETLDLIARQSKKLNGHAAHLYSSVLTAMNMVKDDLETKQRELEAAGLERQLSPTEDCKWL
ncbi:centrosomal protein of 68 kDa isoform X2 [Pristis pectinata]|uniref:centrosomal protein of 68 kDa isoform X2 n=1 Tax=Pristis pectinata TaxID=685728 RepID=UPI00223D7BB9|nr:centrosomal protein of 68 kDa isoform X2 [Pristis pectinata]